jgi:hypothetical protein
MQAEVIIWDFETRQQYCKLVLHRNAVEAVAFTCSHKYLITLGGRDDGRQVELLLVLNDYVEPYLMHCFRFRLYIQLLLMVL